MENVTNKPDGAAEEQAPVATKKIASKKKSVKKADAGGAGFCVYIGPSIRGVIQSGTVFRGERSAVLAELASVVEQRPLIASLVVDGATVPSDRIKVKTPGNLLFVNYRKLVACGSK